MFHNHDLESSVHIRKFLADTDSENDGTSLGATHILPIYLLCESQRERHWQRPSKLGMIHNKQIVSDLA